MSDAIEAAPAGPETGAFFDLDRTTLAGFSALALARDLIVSGRLDPGELPSRLLRVLFAGREGDGFSELMDAVAGMLRGTSERRLVSMGEELFHNEHEARIYPEARQLIAAHLARGHTVALATAATSYQARPIARSLGVDAVLSTHFEVEAGRLTGRIRRPTCWGPGKLRAVREFSAWNGIVLEESFAYSDGTEDLPLLSGVGRPQAVNPDAELERAAKQSGWPVHHFDSLEEPALGNLLAPLRKRPARYVYHHLLGQLDLGRRRWKKHWARQQRWWTR